MEEARKAREKEKKEKVARPEKVDEMLKKLEELEEEESYGMTSQEEILKKMQENPLATLVIGAVVGAALVYYFTKPKGEPGPLDMT